jgi:catechol 2,3-dioxygenase-like lactoylglutathione lyase family enzyme
MCAMRFAHVRLVASDPQAVLQFYACELGLPREAGSGVRVGETVLEFASAVGEPFYHFAFLIPGDRFDAALEWARARVTLLGESVYDFPAWDAQACYFHDPAGSIVELIAHRGIAETGATGGFRAGELVGLSELGLVGDMAAMGEALHDRLGLEVWDGTLTGSLAFVGEQARTLILARPGRGWLPTGRPSEPHPVSLTVDCGSARAVAADLEGGRYRVAMM